MSIDKEKIWREIKDRISSGKSTFSLRLLLLDQYLQEQTKSSMSLNAVLICKGCCEECEKRDGETMALENAIDMQPLPQKQCTRYKTGCVCSYAARSIRNEEGRIIFKANK